MKIVELKNIVVERVEFHWWSKEHTAVIYATPVTKRAFRKPKIADSNPELQFRISFKVLRGMYFRNISCNNIILNDKFVFQNDKRTMKVIIRDIFENDDVLSDIKDKIVEEKKQRQEKEDYNQSLQKKLNKSATSYVIDGKNPERKFLIKYDHRVDRWVVSEKTAFDRFYISRDGRWVDGESMIHDLSSKDYQAFYFPTELEALELLAKLDIIKV